MSNSVNLFELIGIAIIS